MLPALNVIDVWYSTSDIDIEISLIYIIDRLNKAWQIMELYKFGFNTSGMGSKLSPS